MGPSSEGILLNDGAQMARNNAPTLSRFRRAASLKADGTVWAWDDNEYGQRGDGTPLLRLTPIQVSGLTAWKP